MDKLSTARHALPPAGSPDRIKPVSDYVRHDSAPFVKLSPHKGIKNTALIYEAIKDKKPSALVRGDFTKSSEPVLYFPDRPKKKIGCLQGAGVAAAHVQADRKEFANFIQSITSTAQKSSLLGPSELKALKDLNSVCVSKAGGDRDFTVGEIRDALSVLSKISLRQTVQKFAPSHISPLKPQGQRINRKELQEFVDMDLQHSSQLINLLLAGEGKTSTPQAILALVEMKALVRKHLDKNSGGKNSFPDLLRKDGVSHQLNLFARRWLSMAKASDLRQVFADEPWVEKVDWICGLISKQARRNFNITSATDFNDLLRGSTRSLRSEDVLPPLPKIPGPSIVEKKSPVSTTRDAVASLPDAKSNSRAGLNPMSSVHDLAESSDVFVDGSAAESDRLDVVERLDMRGNRAVDDSLAGASRNEIVSLPSAELHSQAESAFSIHLSLSGEEQQRLTIYRREVEVSGRPAASSQKSPEIPHGPHSSGANAND